MSDKSMDVFSLRDSVVGEHRTFATSFTTIFADDIRAKVDTIYAEGRIWPDPPPHVRARAVSQALAQLDARPGDRDAFAERRAQALLPADVIALLVLLPRVD